MIQPLSEILSILDCKDKFHNCYEFKDQCHDAIVDPDSEYHLERVKEVCKKTCGFCSGPTDKPPTGGPTNKPPTGGPTNKPPTGMPTDKPPTGKPGNFTYYNSDSSVKLNEMTPIVFGNL